MGRSGGIDPPIFKLGTRCDSVVSFKPRPMEVGDPQKWQNVLPVEEVEKRHSVLPARSKSLK